MPVLDLGGLTLALGLLTFLVAGTVKGTLGIGLPLVAVPLLATVLDLPTAIALMVVPVLTSNFIQALQGKRKLAKRCAAFFPCFCSPSCPAHNCRRAVRLVGRSAHRLAGPGRHRRAVFALAAGARCSSPSANDTGAVSSIPAVGLVAGFPGRPVQPVWPAADHVPGRAQAREGRRSSRRSDCSLSLPSATLYATLATVGVLTFDNAAGSLVAAIPVMAGVFIGTRLAQPHCLRRPSSALC